MSSIPRWVRRWWGVSEGIPISGLATPSIYHAADPSITFWLTNADGVEHEALRIEPDGRFFVCGRLVETDAEVAAAFVKWVRESRVIG